MNALLEVLSFVVVVSFILALFFVFETLQGLMTPEPKQGALL